MPRILTFAVPDMDCGACVRAITAAVRQLDGTAAVEADLDARRVTVSTAENAASIAAAIAEAGFTVAAG